MEETDCEPPEFQKHAILGKGGFATVYLATATSSLPPVLAVKSVDFPASAAYQVNSPADSLVFESGILNYRLDPSPYVIRAYGRRLTFHPTTHHYTFDLLLEYAPLRTLRHHLKRRGAFSEFEVRHLAWCILHGLQHIHDHGVVHCDLKPANVLLVPSPSPHSLPLPKIADFGLAKLVGEKVDGFRGTTLYAAPESVRESEYEPPSDVWAFGCIVYELLTGRSAWGEDRLAASSSSAFLHLVATTTEMPTLPKHLSKQAGDFLGKCLVSDPELRWTPEMLLSHPFLSMDEERGVKRHMAEVLTHYDDHSILCDSDIAGLGSEEYIPLEVGKRRKIISEEVNTVADQLPSIRTTSGPEKSLSWDTCASLGLGSADYIPLEVA